MFKTLLINLMIVLVSLNSWAGPAVFSGTDIKLLKPNLDFFGSAKILSGSADPNVSPPETAPIGSMFMNTANGHVFRKIDAGSTSGWVRVGSEPLYNSNRLVNPGWEATTSGWTASAGSYSRVTTSTLTDATIGAASWDPTASAQTLSSDAVNFTGPSSTDVVGSCSFKGSSTDTYVLEIYNSSTTTVLATSPVNPTSYYSRTSIKAHAVTNNQNIVLRVKSGKDESAINIDNCYLGREEGFRLYLSTTEGINDKLFGWLKNGDWELGTPGWTASAGTYATTDTAANVDQGIYSGSWDASASAQTLTSDDITITSGDGKSSQSATCSIRVKAASGTATHLLEIYDGTNVLASQAITSSTTQFVRTSVTVAMPASGTVKCRLKAQADEPVIYFDRAYFGLAEGFNISQVSQATFVGSAIISTTASCIWSRTNTALGAFSTTAACPGPTVEFNPGPGTIQTTDTDLPQFTVNNLPPGNYQVVISGSAGAGTTENDALAVSDGTTTSGRTSTSINAGDSGGFHVTGNFSYTTTGNRTFQMYGSGNTNTIKIFADAYNHALYFAIYRYPTSPEMGYRADQVANSWSGYHDSTCDWTTSSGSYADFAVDASCALVEVKNRNFGTVTTVAGTLPGIQFTPSRAGRYFFCAEPSIWDTSATSLSLELVDGNGNVVAQHDAKYDTTAGYPTVLPMCGILDATSTATQTLKFKGFPTGGVGVMHLRSWTGNERAIQWTIFQIDQQLPAPLLVNSVVSDLNGVGKLAAFNGQVNGASSSVVGQLGSVFGYSSGAANVIVWSMSAGTFSATPYCLCTPELSGGFAGTAYTCNITGATSTSVTTETRNATAGTAANAANFRINVLCLGAK